MPSMTGGCSTWAPLLEMMGPVVSKMRELGDPERAIVRALRVIVEELEALEPRRPAG